MVSPSAMVICVGELARAIPRGHLERGTAIAHRDAQRVGAGGALVVSIPRGVSVRGDREECGPSVRSSMVSRRAALPGPLSSSSPTFIPPFTRQNETTGSSSWARHHAAIFEGERRRRRRSTGDRWRARRSRTNRCRPSCEAHAPVRGDDARRAESKHARVDRRSCRRARVVGLVAVSGSGRKGDVSRVRGAVGGDGEAQADGVGELIVRIGAPPRAPGRAAGRASSTHPGGWRRSW